MRLKSFVVLLVLLIVVLISACSLQNNAQLKDGYYTAEADSFDENGWKEYVTVYVSGSKIVTVEYNAKNSSGFIKSWDMQYMRDMNEAKNIYPNKYTRDYAEMLLNWQDADKVDAISGATHSGISFKLLAKAVVQKAKQGDKQVAFVKIPTAAEMDKDYIK